MSKKNKKDLLTLKDYDSKTIKYLLDLAGDIKNNPSKYNKVLEGKNIPCFLTNILHVPDYLLKPG